MTGARKVRPHRLPRPTAATCSDVMRHFLAALTVAARTRRMGKAPLARFLVAPSGLAYLGAAYLLGATTAVALATITTAANKEK